MLCLLANSVLDPAVMCCWRPLVLQESSQLQAGPHMQAHRTGQDRMMMMMTMTMMTMMTMVMTTTMMTMTMMMMTMMMMMLCNHVMHMDCLATATQLVTSGMAVTVTCMSCPVTVCLVNRHPCTVHCCDGPSTL